MIPGYPQIPEDISEDCQRLLEDLLKKGYDLRVDVPVDTYPWWYVRAMKGGGTGWASFFGPEFEETFWNMYERLTFGNANV